MRDIVLTALKAFNRDPQRAGLFMKVLSTATVYVFTPTEVLEADQGPKPERLTMVREEVNGQLENYVPFFSDESRAGRTLEMLLNKQENNERRVSVTALNGADLFFYLDARDLAAYYNPRSRSEESKFLTREFIADLLLQAWEDDFNRKQPKEPRSGKNRHGKLAAAG
ncbi:MAG: SseB family protein [Candidatus Adiutrix sp.]|jgi:hypothetical protein|nr:SseB family protein [Candidatus Adiutrix sp.]